MWRNQRAENHDSSEQPVRAACHPHNFAKDVEAVEGDTPGDRVAAAMSEEGIAILIRHAAAARYAALALVGPADADDAVQEALVRGWRAWATLRDPAAARAWLVRITINVCRQWQRGSQAAHGRLTEPLERLDEVEGQVLTPLASDPGASGPAAALDLRCAIDRLDEGLRVVVALRYYVGLNATEIGKALDIPASTVRTRLSRALELLRDALGDSAERPAISRQEDADG